MDEQLIKVTNNENPVIDLEISVNTNTIDVEFTQSMTTIIMGHDKDIEAHSKIIAPINDNINNVKASILAKADKETTYTKSETEAKLATKIDAADISITKAGNLFNGADQLVKTNVSGRLPALDGSLLINIAPTLDTSNMPIIANNAITPNTQIDFCAGFCWDSTLTAKIISTAMTKKLDAVFAAGNGNGGLDTGSKAVSTKYAVFAISKVDGTSDFLFSTSATTPAMPTCYIYKRRIGWIKTDISGNIIQFYQDGDTFYFRSVIIDFSGAYTTTYTDVVTSAPPNTTLIYRLCSANAQMDSVWIKTAILPDGLLVYHPIVAFMDSPMFNTPIGSNAVISVKMALTTLSTSYVNTYGYIDKRGKN